MDEAHEHTVVNEQTLSLGCICLSLDSRQSFQLEGLFFFFSLFYLKTTNSKTNSKCKQALLSCITRIPTQLGGKQAHRGSTLCSSIETGTRGTQMCPGTHWPHGHPHHHLGCVGGGAEPLCTLYFLLEALLPSCPGAPAVGMRQLNFCGTSFFLIVPDFKELLLFTDFW